MELMTLGYFWLVAAVGAAMVAASKHESGIAYLIGGLILGPVMLLVAIGIAESGRPCERCAETVKVRAKICPWCGNEPPFPEREEQSRSAIHQRRERGVRHAAPPRKWHEER